MKRSSTTVGLVVVLAGVASALGATACGNTESNPDPQPVADWNNGGGGAAGSAGEPQVSGTGGRPSAGTGQTAGAGGSSPGGVPARHPLIVGDDACPAEAPTMLSCSDAELGASCVYRGLLSYVSESNEPFHCVCEGYKWACAQSGENAEATCPFVRELPGPNAACPTSGGPCNYWVPPYLGLASCSCSADDSAGGAAGASGAEAGSSSIWSCGL